MSEQKEIKIFFNWLFASILFFIVPYILALTGIVPYPFIIVGGYDLFNIAAILFIYFGFIGILIYGYVKHNKN